MPAFVTVDEIQAWNESTGNTIKLWAAEQLTHAVCVLLNAAQCDVREDAELQDAIRTILTKTHCTDMNVTPDGNVEWQADGKIACRCNYGMAFNGHANYQSEAYSGD